MSKLVQGQGFNSNKYPSWKDGKRVKEYRLWQDMLFRCTDKCCAKDASYVGTTCSENFKSYEYFYEWCQSQKGFKATDDSGKSWQLDKDILAVNNKLYSEETCVFVPSRVNKLLVKRDSSRGEHPVGVTWHESCKKLQASCRDGTGKLKYLGLFTTTKEAFQAYKTFKENLIKDVANEYKHQLDLRAYKALLNYEVNITD